MPSLALWFARQVVRLGRGPKRSPKQLQEIFKRRRYPSPATPTRAARRGLLIEERAHRDLPYYQLTLKGQRATRRTLLYLHGGGFVMPIHWAHWELCRALAQATEAQITLPTYPLCPEHSLDECHEHLLTLCRALSQGSPSEELIIAGDSAGGNLALCLALALMREGLPSPKRLILFCPWVDLSMSNPTLDGYAQRDPMLIRDTLEEWGRWWSGSRDLRDPLVSPLYARHEGLPPVELYLGEDDMLTPDGLALSTALERAGVEVSTHVTPGAFHDFMAVTFTPEARAVYRRIKARLSHPAR